jgi:hypothetical protein
MGGNDSTEYSRIISVLAFYVFSCSCLHGQRKETNPELKQTAWMWREEIENGPSLLRRTSERPSERPSERQFERCSSNGGASTSHSLVSARSVDLVTQTEQQEPHCMIADQKKEAIPAITISQLPKIHPPVNERHPPVVSALPQLDETSWMTMPPPTARAMENLNRRINAQRNISWDITRSRSGSGSGTSVESTARPSSSETGRTPPRYLPLEMENLMDGTRQAKRPGRRRVRYQEDVLEDLGDDSHPPSKLPNSAIRSKPLSSRRYSYSHTKATGSGGSQSHDRQLEKSSFQRIEMVQLPPVAVLSPIGLPGLGKTGFAEDMEREIRRLQQAS